MTNTLDLRGPIDPDFEFMPSQGDQSRSLALFPSIKGVAEFTTVIDHYLTAIGSAFTAASNELAKANAPPSAFAFSRISYMPDAVGANLVPWPGIAPESLRKVARENIAPQMIIQGRVLDLRRYAKLSTHLWQPGWRIELREGGESPSEKEKSDIRECENFILNCNIDGDEDIRYQDEQGYTQFSDFLASMVYDTFRFDGWAIWTDMDKAGRIAAFRNMPAGNMRLAAPGGVYNDPSKFIALLDDANNPVMTFSRDEMIWRVRNPRNDAGIERYGYSEIEMAIRLIQGFQNAIDLNVDTFNRNAIPNGLMLLQGDFWTQNQIDILMREWNNTKKGITKAWGLPVIGVPKDGDIKLVSMNDLKGTDVRYKDHMNMMAGALCCLTGFPVRRLGYKTSGQREDSEPIAGESTDIVGDDDPGLPPLLQFVEDTLNSYIVWSRFPKLKFTFTGKNPKQDAREYDARKTAQTWREARAHADLPSLPSVAPKDYKEFAEIMELCPEDPAKVGAFQTLAMEYIKVKLGTSDTGGGEMPGDKQPFQSVKDPAKAEQHGKLSGVRRNSRAEKHKDVK
jgi:hypothetical protein